MNDLVTPETSAVAGDQVAPGQDGYQRVVIPCDGALDSTTLAVARGVAGRLGVPLVLLSIVSHGLEALNVTELREIAARVAPDADVEVIADDGRSTAAQLADVAGESGTLMCLRSRAQIAIVEAAFGSVSESLIRSTNLNVLIVGPRCAPEFSGIRMIVAVDPASSTDEARQAVALATVLGLTSEYLTVAADDSPSRVLQTLSETASVAMIAMATRSKGPFDRMVLGSTTLKVIRHAKCPVLVHAFDA